MRDLGAMGTFNGQSGPLLKKKSRIQGEGGREDD